MYDTVCAKQICLILFNFLWEHLNNLCETNSCAKQHCMTPAKSPTRVRVVYVYDITMYYFTRIYNVLLTGDLRSPFRFHVKHIIKGYNMTYRRSRRRSVIQMDLFTRRADRREARILVLQLYLFPEF